MKNGVALLAYRAVGSSIATFFHHLRPLPIDQWALPLVCHNDVRRTYITMQDFCDIEGVRVNFAFICQRIICGHLEVHAP